MRRGGNRDEKRYRDSGSMDDQLQGRKFDVRAGGIMIILGALRVRGR